jgi:hypothetical protein
MNPTIIQIKVVVKETRTIVYGLSRDSMMYLWNPHAAAWTLFEIKEGEPQ